MNAGPYSDEKVQRFLTEEFIPLKSECFWKNRTELMKRFEIGWTPTLLVQDQEGKVHRKLVGYVPTGDLLAQLKHGKGMVFFEKERHEEAAKWFRAVIEQHPEAGVSPEAVFFLGVAEYRKTHEAKALRGIYDMLTSKYPQSEWARRAEPYSAIPQ
jgi:thioredoxin-related protein